MGSEVRGYISIGIIKYTFAVSCDGKYYKRSGSTLQELRIRIQEEIGEHMRKEASIEQWKTLYEAGTRIKELKPWEKFWDMDLIGIKIIKELGYTYRGKNQWLYFLSFEPGYYPYNMDEEEVLRMSEYLQDLELALRYYDEADMQVDFESGNMFLLSFGKDKKTWNFGEEPLPFTAFQFGNLLITDEDLLSDLGKAPKCNTVLEADVSVLGASVTDKKYDRPANKDSFDGRRQMCFIL